MLTMNNKVAMDIKNRLMSLSSHALKAEVGDDGDDATHFNKCVRCLLFAEQ